MSWLFTSDDQNTGASASASVLPMNIQGWSSLRSTGLISLLSKGLFGVFSSTIILRHQFFGLLPSLQSSCHNHTWLTGKTIVLTIWTFVGRVMFLLRNTLLNLGSVQSVQSLSCVRLFVNLGSVQFSCSVVSNSLWPHGLQHTRPPCPSPSPGVHSDSRPSSPAPKPLNKALGHRMERWKKADMGLTAGDASMNFVKNLECLHLYFPKSRFWDKSLWSR